MRAEVEEVVREDHWRDHSAGRRFLFVVLWRW